MYHTVKAKETLSKIAKQYSLPLEIILAFNKTITNPNNISVGQQIYIPNVDDVPTNNITVNTTTDNELVTRAKSAINKGIRYKLGQGGMNPTAVLPASASKQCDCSGFVCWVLGLSRQTDIPFYKSHGGWIFTDSMVADINAAAGIFEKISTPEPGCIVVYGAGGQIGHVGLVSKVKNGQMEKVIHCSSGNDKKFSDSIQETAPDVFNRADTLWGRFVR